MVVWALIVSFAAAFASGGALWYAHRSISAARAAVLEAHAALQGVGASAPNVLTNQQRELTKQFAELLRAHDAVKDEVFTQIGSQDAKLLAWRADVELVLESVEAVLDHTERKRRSVTQREKRAEELAKRETAEVTEVVETDPFKMTREQLNQLVREREGLN